MPSPAGAPLAPPSRHSLQQPPHQRVRPTSLPPARPFPEPGTLDPAVAPLRRAHPQRFRDVQPGHLAVVALAGRPWFIGKVCSVTARPYGRIPCFVQVLNIDNGDYERIPAAAIVELMLAESGFPSAPKR